ncbi:TPA: ThiF family adenylyltransferase [Pseudomonas aeruginosa]|nr:ThiF family adenylyltransferase [Pseudomonas aeruginosa]HEJ5778105.1 ThiF family adenylyltransferase [Pseudomonas aeruginosa]
MKWAIDDPVRFLREQAELDRLAAEGGWVSTAWRLSEGSTIVVDLDMVIHGRVFAGRMTYPDTFPDSPPYICPRDQSERWSNHQYGAGGPLCLQWRADNWNPDVTGADIVRSAHELLSTEQHPELPNSVPSAHRLTAGQSMRGASRRFVATAELLATWMVLPLSSRARLKSAIVYNVGAVVMFAAKVADAQDVLQDVADLPEGVTKSLPLFSLSGEGCIFRSDAFDQRQSVESAEALVRMLAEVGFATDDILMQEAGKYKARTIVLLGTELPSLRVFLIDSGEQPVLLEYRIVWPSLADFRLSEEAQRLANVRVGIVGLGSVGSKVAISLARSGVRRFLLVDDDYLAPGNMVRHELSWAYVGAHKVWAVSDALSLVAAGVQADVRATRIAGQESSVTAAAALKDLSGCDLLIDATANPEVFLLLAALAKRHGTPLCWGEIFAGGYGGMIARARVGRDPNPLAVRDAYHAYLTTLPDAPFKNAAGYDGNEEKPLVAYDSDVGFVATSLTRLAIDTALSRNPSEFPYSVYLLGMRREWIFEGPFDTCPVDVQGRGWERDENTGSDKDRIAVVETLLRMHEGRQGADTDPST